MDLTELKVDGGMIANNTLMQFQADILGVPVVRPVVAETTALGAAYAAGLAVGFWADLDELRANWQEDSRWEPKMDPAERDRQMRLWKKAVTKTFDWVDDDVSHGDTSVTKGLAASAGPFLAPPCPDQARVAAIHSSSLRAAAPLSMAPSATAIFSWNRSRMVRCTWLGSFASSKATRPARVQHHDVADRAARAGSLVHDAGVVLGVAALQLLDRARGMPSSRGSRSCSLTVPRETSQMWLWPVVVGSSRPSSPRNTEAVAPRVWNTPTMSGTRSSWATPTAEASGRADCRAGPRKLNTVGTPSCARTGPACLKPGWNAAANANVMPASPSTSATRRAGA